MKKYLAVLALLAVLSLVLGGCEIKISGNGLPSPANTAIPSSGSAHFGKQTKTSGCAAHGGLPDSACTPGAIFPNATVQQICTSGYASSVRNVPSSEKDQVYAEYGIHSHYAGQYEVDHLVSLELGGSNDIANLWPEAASPSDKLRIQPGAIGTLITAPLKNSADAGATTFTLVLPNVKLGGQTKQPIETFAIITQDYSTLQKVGAQFTYKVVPLQGTGQYTDY